MKKVIYSLSVFVMCAALIMGFDNWFGPEVKSFCSILFFVWIAQTVTGNWKTIKEFMNILFGVKK